MPEQTNIETTIHEIVVSRTYDAPRELVFKVWTDPEQVVQWWGPNGFTTTNIEMDLRPGGMWRYTMHGPDGTDYPNRMDYTEVVPPERLAYMHGDDSQSDEESFSVTVHFEDLGSRTKVTMTANFMDPENLKKHVEQYGAIEGGRQTMGRLAEYLANLRG